MADECEWLKLPTDEKCVHKAWKARIAGYEEAAKLFPTLEEKSPEFMKYLGIIKKFIVDSNAFAQEKGLDAVLAFAENAAVAGKTTCEVISGVVAKCLNSSRTHTREKAMELILMYIEIEKQETVMEELIKGLTNKQPKIVSGCVLAIREAVREFGNKVVPIKPIVKQLQPLLDHRDKTVREEAKMLVVEMYRWVRDAIKPQLSNLKPVQITELETEFANLGSEKAIQTRFLRSQQDLKAKMESEAAAGGDDGGDEEQEVEEDAVDAFDLLDPVEILSKMPKDFYEKIEAKKWQERKEALEAIKKLTENPKIQPGDFGDLVRTLIKVIGKDSNVMLVTLGAKVLADLANGLRKKFQPYSLQCVKVILEKFKEKKTMVVAALRDAIDAVFTSTSLEAVSEDLVICLEHKNPSIKQESILFLIRCFTTCTPATLPKKLLKIFCSLLVKTTSDTVPDVREASYQALGTAMKVVSERHMQPYLADIEAIKLTKVKEYYEKAELTNMKVKSGPSTKATPAPSKPAPVKKTVERPKTASSARPGTAAGKKKTSTGKSKSAAKKSPEEVTENPIADEVVEEKAGTILPGDTYSKLASTNWKERLAAMETFTQVVKDMSREEMPVQVIVRTINKKPGLKDTNFQVLKARLDLLAYVAKNGVFTTRSATYCISDLVDKVGDAKNGVIVQECFSCIAEAASLEYVSEQLINQAFEQKNPKNQSEALNWICTALKEFGFKVKVKALIESIKKALASPNPAVRTAGITLIGVIHMYMGAQIRMLFDSEKPALLQQIDDEIAKVKDEKPPAPSRGQITTSGTADGTEEEEAAMDDGEVNIADLVPRVDIGDKITEDLITGMADKNWKIRNEGLQKVIAILNDAKFIQGNIGGLPEALKLRLTKETNKLLVNTALSICLTLGQAMGPHSKVHIRVLGPALLTCCGDSKPNVRASAVATLNAWVEHTGLLPLLENEVMSDTLKMENPNLRAEILGWLSEKLPSTKKLPVAELLTCVPHLYSCLEDRNPTVRQKAQEAIVSFMIHVGFEKMNIQAGKLKPSSKDQIKPLLDKARANLPAKPVRTESKPAAPKVVQQSLEADEVDEAKPPTKSVKSKPAAAKTKQAAPAKSRKIEPEVDSSPLFVDNTSKAQRFKDEKNLKCLKWNFTVPRGEFVEQIKTQFEGQGNKSHLDQMFHADFKLHIKAIDTMTKNLQGVKEGTIAQLDLILKWFTLRFFDTNTSVLLKGLEYLQALFQMLSEEEYHLQEIEATSFIPYLILKVGDPKDSVRRNVRNIFKLICKVYPASKMFSYVINGLTTKNTKQKTECLEELGSLIEIYGINVCQPSPAQALKLIAQQIGTRDNGVRSASLNTVVAAYMILGEGVYKYVGQLNDKDLAMLEERIKRSAKNRPPSNKSSPEEKPKTARPIESVQQQRVSPPERGSSPPAQRTQHRRIQGKWDKTNYEIPTLVEHDDDDLNEPVDLPVIKTRLPSPSMKLISGSNDASSAIDLVIAQIASNNITHSVQALQQIDEVLKNEEKAELMETHVDHLLIAMTLQLRMLCTKHMSDPNTPMDEVIKLNKCLLGTVLSVFQSKALGKFASTDVLKGLVYNLVTILLDSRLLVYPEGSQVIRAVNVTTVKIVENSDKTNIMSALIRLIQECVGSETCSAQFLELVMKCSWKVVRMLPSITNELDHTVILLDCHNFLKAFPMDTWKQRPSDTPLRTIKTILHSLTTLEGSQMLKHMSQVNGLEGSDIHTYIMKVLSRTNKDTVSATNTKNQQMNGPPPAEDNKTKKEGKSPRRLSKSTHDQLAEIFKKIGSKENTTEGLNNLFDFKLKHPEADLEPFLKKSSQFFQNYIERGLRNIEMERNTKKENEPCIPKPAAPSNAEPGSCYGDINPSAYMERLKVLREKLGLDNAQSTGGSLQNIAKPDSNTDSSSSTHTMSKSTEDLSSGQNPQVTASDVSDLKKRLEQIKQQAASRHLPMSKSSDNLSSQASDDAKQDLKKRLELIKQGTRDS